MITTKMKLIIVKLDGRKDFQDINLITIPTKGDMLVLEDMTTVRVDMVWLRDKFNDRRIHAEDPYGDEYIVVTATDVGNKCLFWTRT